MNDKEIRALTLESKAGVEKVLRNRRSQEVIVNMLPAQLKPRLPMFLQAAVFTIMKEPKLQPSYYDPSQKQVFKGSDPNDVLKQVIIAARLGLMPDGSLGHAYLLPYRKKGGIGFDPQLVIGYKGMQDLAHRSGKILKTGSVPVYSKEIEEGRFEILKGAKDTIEHRPIVDRDPGDLILIYSGAHLVNGDYVFDWMNMYQIKQLFKRTNAAYNLSLEDIDRLFEQGYLDGKGKSPWFTDLQAMQEKTVMRRLFNRGRIPMSPEDVLGQGMIVDNAAEAGKVINLGSLGIDDKDIDGTGIEAWGADEEELERVQDAKQQASQKLPTVIEVSSTVTGETRTAVSDMPRAPARGSKKDASETESTTEEKDDKPDAVPVSGMDSTALLTAIRGKAFLSVRHEQIERAIEIRSADCILEWIATIVNAHERMNTPERKRTFVEILNEYKPQILASIQDEDWAQKVGFEYSKMQQKGESN